MRNALIGVVVLALAGAGFYFSMQENSSSPPAQSSDPYATDAASEQSQPPETLQSQPDAAQAQPDNAAQSQPGETAQAQPAQAQGGTVDALEYLSDQPQRRFSKAEQVIDAAKYDYTAEIETSKGKVVIDLFENEAPKTVNSFVFLALNRYYEGIVFHRVIPGFMAQTGDPTGTGSGGPGYQFGMEVTPKLNYDKAGVLGMARTNDPNSNGSQFFITFQPTPFLNQQYSIFGQVVAGQDVVDKIAPTEGVASPARGEGRDKIVSVKILQKAK